MTLFWIIAALMLVVAATFIVFPLIKITKADDNQRQDALNTAFYRHRLAELDLEDRDGLVNNKDELIVELKASLLQDIPASSSAAQANDRISFGLTTLSAFLLLIAISGGMYFSLGGYHKVAEWLDVSQRLPELSARLMQSSGEPLTDQEMQDLNLALRTRLFENPNDAMGWLLLGKISLAKYDATNAVEAFAKAYQIDSSSSSIRYGYAQALLASGEENNKQQAVDLLNRLLAEGSTDIRVYSLLALHAFDGQQYSEAINYWQTMQTILGPQDSRTAWLEEQITQANALLSKQQNMSDKHVVVNISLDQSMAANARGVMIISVHDSFGSPMPVAAVRLAVPTFPYQVTVDDSNSLMEARPLSSLDQFRVKVRIDSDGNVATQENDIYGESEVTNFGQSVAVEVNKRY